MLGMAAYGLKRMSAIPPLSWPRHADGVAIPERGNERGGAVGYRT
jgi:hypothetical protein